MRTVREPARPGRPRGVLGRARRTVDALDTSELVLLAAMALWIVVFGTLVWQRHERFGSFGFDMGIFDQAVWLVARGESLITVRGLDVFGHHGHVAFLLLAPFSWLGAGPHFLNLLQVGALGLGAVPLYLIGRERGLPGWIALVPAVAFLAHPSVQFLAWELFHPETVAITPLLFAYLAAVRQRWGWYAGLSILAVSWKEDVALAVFFLGLLVALRGHRRIGALTMGLSLGWFLFVSQVLLPAVNGVGPFYSEFYGELGDAPTTILWNAITTPGLVWERFTDPGALEYLWMLAAPFALLALAAPGALLVGVPQVVANILSIHDFTREITFHYAALPVAALALASAEGLARLRRDGRLRNLAALAMVVAALAATVRWGPSPIGDRFDEGFWPAAGDPRRPTQREAVAMVPSDAAVSATYNFVAHLSHRRAIYEFPNPFEERNWGVHGENTHDPAVVEWIVIDRHVTGTEDRATLERVLVSGDWAVVLDEDDIVVAHRP